MKSGSNRVYLGRREGLGLALSGGGFRATLFHLGALWRLNELRLLSQIERISAVSGGAILNGLLSVNWNDLEFKDGVASNFEEVIAVPIMAFCSRTIDIRSAILGLALGTRPLIREYRKGLVGDVNLQDIPDKPEFVFNTTHIETGRNWHFSKEKAETYRLGYISSPRTDLATVIAASSACPPFFAPVVIRFNPKYYQDTELSLLYKEEKYRKDKLYLTDGGVYDNLGAQKILRFKVQLFSDASGPLATKGKWWWRAVKNRTLNPSSILQEQTRSLRRQSIVNNYRSGAIDGALWTIFTPLKEFASVQNPFVFPRNYEKKMSGIGTRLRAFSESQMCELVNWGYVQCDLSVRTNYIPETEPPVRLPFD